jgi:1,4-alpha-glucan branching enzyme
VLGAVDLHLFNEGTHQRLWQVLGAQVMPQGGVRFAVWAPAARRVAVVGDFCAWNADRHVMQPQGSSGVWAVHVPEAAVDHRYKFVVDGADGRQRWKADPMARRAELPPSDASIVVGESTFAWSDVDWMAQRDRRRAGERPLRIYEVHLGSWREVAPQRAFVDLAEPLARHVSELGFTHVELLPVAEHPFGGSWGYQVSGYYAPTARYGTPDELRSFVDVLHAHGVGVILDWVPAHFPKDEWALARFDGTAMYEHLDPRRGEHPDWGTYVFNYGRHEVRSFLLSNAHYWFHEFHIDGLRVDAVASMLYLDYSRSEGDWLPNRHGGRDNLEAISLLQHVNSSVLTAHPGVVMAAEESTAWPGVTLPPDAGGLGFTHKWNMGWMNDTLAYFSREPVHRRWHHHELTFGLLYGFSETFVLPLSHDEVVHGKGSLLAKMPGDDWQRFANLRALYAWMWAHPGDTLVFMGAELAPWTEWADDAPLPWHLLGSAPHAGVHELLRDLGRLAHDWSAMSDRQHDASSFQWLDADDAEHSVYAFLRWGVEGGDAMVCVANLTPVPRAGYRVGVPWAGTWQVIVDTDEGRFGGSGHRASAPQWLEAGTPLWQGQSASVVLDVPPLAVVWLAARRP